MDIMEIIRGICPDAAFETTPANFLQWLKDQDKAECPICLGTYEGLHHHDDTATTHLCSKPIMTSACRHVFGATCLANWMRSQTTDDITCPSCRTVLGPKAPSRLIFANIEEWLRSAEAAFDAAVRARDGLDVSAQGIHDATSTLLAMLSLRAANYPVEDAVLLGAAFRPGFDSPQFVDTTRQMQTAAFRVVYWLNRDDGVALRDHRQEVRTGARRLWRMMLNEQFHLYRQRYMRERAQGDEARARLLDSEYSVRVHSAMGDRNLPADMEGADNEPFENVERFMRMMIGLLLT